nr:DUF2786 domain-containing protein [Streptomyces anulatus]
MEGSLPVWYHIVTSPQERAAAKAYSGAPSASVLRVRTGVDPVQEPFDLFPSDTWGTGDESEWYPEPGIDVHYDRDSAFDLGALLAVARLGYARLEFLVLGADGGVQRLRTVLARVREEDRRAWRKWALAALEALAPEPDDLADAITRQDNDGDGADQDADDGHGPEQRRTPEERVVRAAGGLPAVLLGKVRALLRQAEDPSATEQEARTFLDKATELMAKYGIEQAMLEDESDPGKPVDKVVDVYPPVREGGQAVAELDRGRDALPLRVPGRQGEPASGAPVRLRGGSPRHRGSVHVPAPPDAERSGRRGFPAQAPGRGRTRVQAVLDAGLHPRGHDTYRRRPAGGEGSRRC